MPDCQEQVLFYATSYELVNVSDKGIPSWGEDRSVMPWGTIVWVKNRGTAVSLYVFIAEVVGPRSHGNEDTIIVFEFHLR
jgi:hypothetical protein